MHPDDDVARNIRREQQADAMPSQEEVEADHRKHLASEGCAFCDEDDPDRLGEVQPELPSCSAVQKPRDPFVVVCDEHVDEVKSLRERALEGGRERGLTPAVVFYECGNFEYVETEPYTEDVQVGWDENDDPIWEEREWLPQETPWPTTAQVQIECQCGAIVDEWLDLRGDDE